MKTTTPKENAHTYSCSYPLGENQTTKQRTRVPVRLRKATREKLLENAFTYRVTMNVRKILKFPNGSTYPVCPRCNISIEREYMSYCDRCGQKLGWSKFDDAFVVYPGYACWPKRNKKRHLSIF